MNSSILDEYFIPTGSTANALVGSKKVEKEKPNDLTIFGVKDPSET